MFGKLEINSFASEVNFIIRLVNNNAMIEKTKSVESKDEILLDNLTFLIKNRLTGFVNKAIIKAITKGRV
jgi:hypothetical protein